MLNTTAEAAAPRNSRVSGSNLLYFTRAELNMCMVLPQLQLTDDIAKRGGFSSKKIVYRILKSPEGNVAPIDQSFY